MEIRSPRNQATCETRESSGFFSNNDDGEDRACTYEGIAANTCEIEIRIKYNYVGPGKELSLNLTNRAECFGLWAAMPSRPARVLLSFYGVFLDYDECFSLAVTTGCGRAGLGETYNQYMHLTWNSLSLESVRANLRQPTDHIQRAAAATSTEDLSDSVASITG